MVKKIFNWKPLSNQKITRKTQAQMGGKHQKVHLPNKDKKTGKPASRIEGSGKR
jgi:hypothetical protein